MPRVLHLLSQRPGRTGSGVTLAALVRRAAARGWDQRVVAGLPAGEPQPILDGLPSACLLPLRFERPPLDFPVPGMSDVMPYPSTRFSAMTGAELESYRGAWSDHVSAAVRDFRPDVIHSHHIWLLSSMLKDLPGCPPVLNQCHATGLRQMELCPHLAAEVRRGCARNDLFQVLRRDHAEALAGSLAVDRGRIRVVPAGYRADIFHRRGRAADPGPSLLYVGKYSRAKGLPQLLDAMAELAPKIPGLTLHVAGSGAGPEAEDLAARMDAMGAAVRRHGALDQPRLAELMRRCAACVLPSFYEGVPLVLVEAAACGCRLVATALPGVVEQLAPALGSSLSLVEPPRLRDIDRPAAEDLPEFTARLAAALAAALAGGDGAAVDEPLDLAGTFGWEAVFDRVEQTWLELIGE